MANQSNGELGFWGSLLLILKGYRVPVQQSNACKFQASLPNATSGRSSIGNCRRLDVDPHVTVSTTQEIRSFVEEMIKEK